MNLNDALAEFDAVETTLRRLEEVWERLSALVRQDVSFVGDSAEGIEYEDLRRAYQDLVGGLPPIDGWTITEFPWSLDEIAQNRFDANDIGEIEALVSVEQGVSAPGKAIREYRFRFNRARRVLVRQRAQEILREVAGLLPAVQGQAERDNQPITAPEWETFVERFQELDRVMGSSIRRTGRWNNLRRHISFAQGIDAHDIADHDWPTVVADVEAALYGEFEPMPVQIDDLGALAATEPQGSVATKLAWNVLDEEAFERLIFNLIRDAPGYKNVLWVTRTHAADRGRDVSADRVLEDSLSGVRHHRVFIQCRHWQTRSIRPPDVAETVASMKLADGQPVDVLIIASSGRFTTDAVSWIEKHNDAREKPPIEMWPESHLESLLAERPHLVTALGLRPHD